MKWYIWLAIAVALGLIIWAVTKKKPAAVDTPLASNTGNVTSPVYNFNPYQLTNIG